MGQTMIKYATTTCITIFNVVQSNVVNSAPRKPESAFNNALL